MADEVNQTNGRADFIRGLRELADWLDSHPNVPVEMTGTMPTAAWQVVGYDGNDPRAEMGRIARAMGHAEKRWQDHGEGYLELRRNFPGGVYYEAWTTRKNVCERVVIGEEEVEVTDPDAPTITKMVPKVEWRCTEPLLAAESLEEVE